MALESSKEDAVRLLFSKYKTQSSGKSEKTDFFFIAPNYCLLGGEMVECLSLQKTLKILPWLT